MSEGTSMPDVQISVDVERITELRIAARDALLKAERAMKKLHLALKDIDDEWLTKFPPGTVQPMSGGGKDDPPGDGGNG